MLYQMIAPYLPIVMPNDTGLDFIGKILDAIIADNQHHVYLDMVALMYGIRVDKLIELDAQDLINMFAEGLQENKIFALRDFFEKVGIYGDRRK